MIKKVYALKYAGEDKVLNVKCKGGSYYKLLRPALEKLESFVNFDYKTEVCVVEYEAISLPEDYVKQKGDIIVYEMINKEGMEGRYNKNKGKIYSKKKSDQYLRDFEKLVKYRLVEIKVYDRSYLE